MFSRSFKRVGLHYTAFRNAIREDSRQTTPSRGVTPRKKFAAQANVESRVKQQFLKSCETPIIIEKDDSDYVRQLKKDMIDLKIECRVKN